MPGFGTMRTDAAAKLHQTVVLQKRDPTASDGRGHQANDWQDVRTDMRASIRQLSGSEAELARQQFATATHRIRIRAIRDATVLQDLVRMRIVFRGQNYYIGSISETDNRRRFMDLVCSEGDA